MYIYVYIYIYIHTHRIKVRVHVGATPKNTYIHIHTHTHRIKVRVHVGATPFNGFETPLLDTQRPAGVVVSFRRPPAAKFKKDVKIKIKVFRWIQIIVKLLEAKSRRALGEGEFVLGEEEILNTYLEGGVLMWRGARLVQIRSTEENKVAMASFDRATEVCVCVHVCVPPVVCICVWHACMWLLRDGKQN
jgi:hypothetical protein